MKKKNRKDDKMSIRLSNADKKYLRRLSKKFKTTTSDAILKLVRNYVLFDEIETLNKKIKSG